MDWPYYSQQWTAGPSQHWAGPSQQWTGLNNGVVLVNNGVVLVNNGVVLVNNELVLVINEQDLVNNWVILYQLSCPTPWTVIIWSHTCLYTTHMGIWGARLRFELTRCSRRTRCRVPHFWTLPPQPCKEAGRFLRPSTDPWSILESLSAFRRRSHTKSVTTTWPLLWTAITHLTLFYAPLFYRPFLQGRWRIPDTYLKFKFKR